MIYKTVSLAESQVGKYIDTNGDGIPEGIIFADLAIGGRKDNVDLQEFKESMKDVYSSSVGISTLDEAPMAYKPIESIINNIKDTVEIKEVVKPIYNFKAH